mmetsp:Transcript_106464/g.188522  ORF Transcript_106464/g.188522 Transcript_106464/m.188522 type:complete len:87 (+) Transcript_106464:339-599(+)
MTTVTVTCSEEFRSGASTESPGHMSNSLPRDTRAALAVPRLGIALAEQERMRLRGAEPAHLSIFGAEAIGALGAPPQAPSHDDSSE